MAPDTLRPGTQCWFSPADLTWVKCEITSITGQRVTVVLPDGNQRTVAVSDVEAANSGVVKEYCDITQLTHLNEPSILELLGDRFVEAAIYTSAGPVLVAVNPCKRIPELFTEELRKSYQDASLEAKLPPHMYKVVAAAYRSMQMDGANQALVVSGESGAGKTESTKMALDYFATMSGGSGISSAILQSSPILEAFGNAKTTRNPNSSRFGKLLQVYFSLATDGYTRRLNSAEIHTYLLEKSRVVGPGQGERNYHAFYMLLAGASPEQRAAWHLPPAFGAAAEFSYTQQGVAEAEGRNDEADWREMCEAMGSVGLKPQEQEQIFRLLAGILWLGNISFLASDVADSCSIHPDSGDALAKAAALLGLKPQELQGALTTRQLQVGRDVVVKTLKEAEARVARDSLAKGAYSALFDWLVARINQQLNPSKKLMDSDKFIAVLDIFGFEHFKVNSFEQLCINYANERLQQLFCVHLFEHEQAEYRREGLQWAMHQYSDNAHLVALLDSSSKPLGVLKLLDDQCMQRGGGSDANLLEALRAEHGLVSDGRGGMRRGGLAIPARPPGTFAVEHFAGPVGYSVEGMVAKNMDDLSLGLKQLMASSSSALLKQLGTSLLEDISRRRSVANTFGRQMNRLVDTLQRAQLHFVRCIKPNPQLQPGQFQSYMVLDQIRCAGVVEVGRIFKEGFPTRTDIALFLRRFNRSLKGLDLPAAPAPPPPPSPAPPSTSPDPTALPSAAATALGNPSQAIGRSCVGGQSAPAAAPSPAGGGAGGAAGDAGESSRDRAQADVILQKRFNLKPGEHYALGISKIFFRAGVLGMVEAEFQRLERLSLHVQSCAAYWRDYARVEPLRRRFMELARGHREWLAEQARLKELEEQKRRLEAERAAAETARMAADAAAAAERQRRERELREAEEEARLREEEEEALRQERLAVQRMWQEAAAEREARQKLEAEAEAEREARRQLEAEVAADREARKMLEQVAAAQEQLQERLAMLEREKQEREEAERQAKERGDELAAQLEAIRLKQEEEVRRREVEAAALKEREEALRAKEREMEALLEAQRQRLAQQMAGGGEDGQMSQMLGAVARSRSRQQVQAEIERGQAASAQEEVEQRHRAETKTRVARQFTAIIATARLRSQQARSGSPTPTPPSDAIPEDEVPDYLRPPSPLLNLPSKIHDISMADVPIFDSPAGPFPPSPFAPTPGAGGSIRHSREDLAQAHADAVARAQAERQAAEQEAVYRRLQSYRGMAEVVVAVENGAAASHPLSSDLIDLVKFVTAKMAMLDEDVVWLEGVKAGKESASAMVDLQEAEIKIKDSWEQLQDDVKDKAKELRAELKSTGGAGAQQITEQLRDVERAFSAWDSKFSRAFGRARHARDHRGPTSGDTYGKSNSSVGRKSRNPFKRFFSSSK